MAAENYFLRNSAGEACGPGDREDLSANGGASAVTKILDAAGDSWNLVETARTVIAGQWMVTVYYDSTIGSGPQNKIRVLVQIRGDDCIVKQTLLDETVVVSKGKNGAQFTVSADVPTIVLAADDLISLTLFKPQGNQIIKVRYNGTVTQQALSKLRQPGDNVTDSKAEVSWIELEIPDAP